MLEKLKGKKIAIVGRGVNNQKLSEYLAAQNISFETIEGWTSSDELVGKLDSFDVIFRTPGLPFLSLAIQQAKAKGVEISSQTKLFFELCPAMIIGVTGTKGKGTTSSLIVEILKTAGKTVWLGGNIGRDPFEFLDRIKPEDFVVLELSSFQLQDLDRSPHIAVVLNITTDHLNHHKSLEEYREAKSSILFNQTSKDFAVLHPALPESFKALGQGKKIIFNTNDVAGFETKLLGRHNLENIAAAVEVGKILNVDESVIRKAVSEFESLPHRLKVIKEANGITYIDDAFSTNTDPTSAAIDAVGGKIILIIGGSDKGLDFAALGEKIKSEPKITGLVVIGQVADKIIAATKGFEGKVLTGAQAMPEILNQAKSLAETGDTILFSPATASFGMFKNETDRANQFVENVMKLK